MVGSRDREEAVLNIAETIGIGHKFVKVSLTPKHKSEVLDSLQTEGYRVNTVTLTPLIC